MKGAKEMAGARWIDTDEEGALEVGDRVRLKTGEELMVINVCYTTYRFKSLNGQGKPMMTMEELDAVIDRVL